MALHVGVAYATPSRQVWLKLDVPEGTTVADAIARSGILAQFPEIDLERQKVGIFGKVAPLAAPVADGDRIEIYRPITADPAKILGRDDD
jgi:uncharacterized protein